MHHGQGTEALHQIQKAIHTAGPQAGLLSTRGNIYLRLGRLPEAIKDLAQASAEAPSASVYMHLAQARLLSNDRNGAQDAWRNAVKAGLQPGKLDPLERPLYVELLGKFN